MRSVAVISAAYTTYPDQWAILRDSAAACGVAAQSVGAGKGFSDTNALNDYLDLVKNLADDYVLVTDAYDTMMCRWDAEEVMRRIDLTPSGIVLSCESNCYPAGEWAAAYGPPMSRWWYANGGQAMGRRDTMLALWEEMRSGKWPVTNGGGTQEMLHRMFAAGKSFGFDSLCEIFQSMADSQGAVTCSAGVVTNNVTGTRPMLLHFNGRTHGLQEMYKQWKGRA